MPTPLTEFVIVRVTARERLLWLTAAADRDVTLSAYVRGAVREQLPAHLQPRPATGTTRHD